MPWQITFHPHRKTFAKEFLVLSSLKDKCPFSLAFFLSSPLPLISVRGTQQQWELSEKDEEKNGQNLLPIKSCSGMNFRIGILFTKNNRCPPVLLGWNFPLRDVKAAAHSVLTLCLLCSYDWDLVFVISKHKMFGKHSKMKHSEFLVQEKIPHFLYYLGSIRQNRWTASWNRRTLGNAWFQRDDNLIYFTHLDPPQLRFVGMKWY